MNTTDERWLPVPGYGGWYEVSSHGRLRSWRGPGSMSHKRRIEPLYLKPIKARAGGYIQATLTENGRQTIHYVHRLVAAAFLGPCPEGIQVCHNNGNPADNRLSNLRYDTPKGNMADTRRHGTYRRGEQVVRSKLTEFQVLDIRKRNRSGDSQASIASRFGVTPSCISRVATGDTWGWLNEEA
jgi:hypothetical protein